jgi:hypothetical protein
VKVNVTTAKETDLKPATSFSVPKPTISTADKPVLTFGSKPSVAAPTVAVPATSVSKTETAKKLEPPSVAPASMFSFSTGAPPAAFTSFGSASSSSGFSFPLPTTVAPTAPSSFSNSFGTGGFTKGDDDGDDYEGEPILEPEKILRNENDKDKILVEADCKLLYFNSADQEWKDKGKGSFRLTLTPETGKKRMLVRNTMGKITFNAAFYKGMKFERSKDSIVFGAFVSVDDKSPPEFVKHILRLKKELCGKVMEMLQEAVKEV